MNAATSALACALSPAVMALAENAQFCSPKVLTRVAPPMRRVSFDAGGL